MENSKRKVRIWLLVLLVAAIAAAAAAYYLLGSGQSEPVKDGTMIHKMVVWGRSVCL